MSKGLLHKVLNMLEAMEHLSPIHSLLTYPNSSIFLKVGMLAMVIIHINPAVNLNSRINPSKATSIIKLYQERHLLWVARVSWVGEEAHTPRLVNSLVHQV